MDEENIGGEGWLRVRVPETLRKTMWELAKKNQRSINAEVTARLEASLSNEINYETAELKRIVSDMLVRLERVERKTKVLRDI